MSVIYKDISVLINNAKWQVIIADKHMVTVPYYYRKHPEYAELYEGEGMSHSSITIHRMVELCSEGVSFMIPSQKDMVTVYKYLKEYMLILGRYIIDLNKTHDFVRYYKKCKITEKVLTELATQADNLEIKNNVYEETPSLTAMLHML